MIPCRLETEPMGELKVAGGGQTDQALDLYYSRPPATALVKNRRGVEMAPKTWANWAWEGKGPQWKRLGRSRVAQARAILTAIDAMLTNDIPPQGGLTPRHARD
jgi:hypothetical protein